MALVEVVAVLAVRNEEVYLGNALRHLKANGIKFAVIDNQSDDDTQSIIQSSEFSSDLVEARNVAL
jgi:glycosyltransferase involved in cell wall biosynthesis